MGSGGDIQERREDTGLLSEYIDQFEGTKVDEIEFVDGGGGGEVLNVDGTASGSVGSTESNLEGSGRMLRMCSDRRVRS